MGYAVVTAVFGDYWSRFGEQFVESTQALSPAVDEVVVVSDKPIMLPKGFHNVVGRVMQWDSFNLAVAASVSDWVCPVGIDDTFLVDAFAGLPQDCDVVSTTGQRSDGGLFQANAGAYAGMLNSSDNPMSGGVVMRRHVWNTCLWRRVVWPDWMQWLEINKRGYKVVFDEKVRFNFIRHDDAHSTRPSSLGQEQIDDMRKFLQKHDVVPGVAFPPELVR